MRLLVVALLAVLVAQAAEAVILINNGLAPPNPGNVIVQPADAVRVQNVGCDASVADPCVAPGAATVVEISDPTGSISSSGGGYFAEVRQTSELQALGYGTVNAYDQSLLRVLGYALKSADAHDRAVVQLETGGYVGGTLTLHDRSHVIAMGGFAEELWVRDDARVTLVPGMIFQNLRLESTQSVQFDGRVQQDLETRLFTNVSILGGLYEGELLAYDDSTLSVFGGDVNGTTTRAFDDATVQIFGSGFTVDGLPVGFGPITATSGVLAGTLSSGETFQNHFFQRLGAGQITLIPEPGTGLLVGLGLLGLAGWRDRRGAPDARARSRACCARLSCSAR